MDGKNTKSQAMFCFVSFRVNSWIVFFIFVSH